MAQGMSLFQLPRQRYISSFQPRTIEAKAATNPPALVLVPSIVAVP